MKDKFPLKIQVDKLSASMNLEALNPLHSRFVIFGY